MRANVRKLIVGGATAALLLALGVGTASAAELTVSAAASLTNAFKEMKEGFEKSHPGTTLTFNFAASGPLLKQIEEGAPVDVFASADQETMDKAAAKKLVNEATRKDFAANSLVMIVPSDSKLGLSAPADLGKAEVARIAVGNPDSVPAGRYSRDALTAAGLWETLKPKFVLAESVRQALDYVSRGEADAGFVYMTDAKVAGDKVKIASVMKNHAPVTYPIALTAGTKNAEAAKAFLEYVLGEQGRTVLAKYGFSKP